MRQDLDAYARALAHIRDRVVKMGYRISNYNVSIRLLETVCPPLKGLAQSIFNDLLELDSRGRREIDYVVYGHRLIKV